MADQELGADLRLSRGEPAFCRRQAADDDAGAEQIARISVTGPQYFWGILALVGLVVVGWASLHVGGNRQFVADITHGWGAIAIALDLLFVAIPVVAFMVMESYRLGMRWPWIWVPLILPLPGAFVIPLFFLLRERALLRIKGNAS